MSAQQRHKIFIGGLPPQTKPEELRHLFEDFGTVTECDVMNRCGFVYMETKEMYDSAIESLNGSDFKGHPIVVEAGRDKDKKHEEEGGGGEMQTTAATRGRGGTYAPYVGRGGAPAVYANGGGRGAMYPQARGRGAPYAYTPRGYSGGPPVRGAGGYLGYGRGRGYYQNGYTPDYRPPRPAPYYPRGGGYMQGLRGAPRGGRGFKPRGGYHHAEMSAPYADATAYETYEEYESVAEPSASEAEAEAGTSDGYAAAGRGGYGRGAAYNNPRYGKNWATRGAQDRRGYALPTAHQHETHYAVAETDYSGAETIEAAGWQPRRPYMGRGRGRGVYTDYSGYAARGSYGSYGSYGGGRGYKRGGGVVGGGYYEATGYEEEYPPLGAAGGRGGYYRGSSQLRTADSMQRNAIRHLSQYDLKLNEPDVNQVLKRIFLP